MIATFGKYIWGKERERERKSSLSCSYTVNIKNVQKKTGENKQDIVKHCARIKQKTYIRDHFEATTKWHNSSRNTTRIPRIPSERQTWSLNR